MPKHRDVTRVQTGGPAMQEETSQPLTYTPQQVGALLNVDARTVRKYIRLGVIPSRQLGRRLLVPAGALRAWVEEGRQSQ